MSRSGSIASPPAAGRRFHVFALISTRESSSSAAASPARPRAWSLAAVANPGRAARGGQRLLRCDRRQCRTDSRGRRRAVRRTRVAAWTSRRAAHVAGDPACVAGVSVGAAAPRHPVRRRATGSADHRPRAPTRRQLRREYDARRAAGLDARWIAAAAVRREAAIEAAAPSRRTRPPSIPIALEPD